MSFLKMRIHFILIALFWIVRKVKGNSGYTCPNGWWQRNDRCYIFWSKLVPLTYEGGKGECAFAGAQLYVPNSDSEYNDVVEFIASSIQFYNYVWIGCDEKEEEGVFKCMDGTELDTSSVWWGDSEPDVGTSEKCVDIKYETEKLLDSTCTDLDIILCEGPATPLPVLAVSTTAGQEPSEGTLSTLTTGAPELTAILSSAAVQTTNGDTTNIATITDTTTTTTTKTNDTISNINATSSATTTTTTTNTTKSTNMTNSSSGNGTVSTANIPSSRRSAMFSLPKKPDGSPLHGYCLSGYILKKYSVTSKIKCAGLCLARNDCRSFNCHRNVCTLNSRQRHEVKSASFVPRSGCQYYDRSL